MVADTKLTLIGEHVIPSACAECSLPGAPLPNGLSRSSLAPPSPAASASASASASVAATASDAANANTSKLPRASPERPISTLGLAHSVSSVCISNSHASPEDATSQAQLAHAAGGAGAGAGGATSSAAAVQLVTLCNTGEASALVVTQQRRKSNLQEVTLNQPSSVLPIPNGPLPVPMPVPVLRSSLATEQQPVSRSPSVRFKLSNDSLAADPDEQRHGRIAIEPETEPNPRQNPNPNPSVPKSKEGSPASNATYVQVSQPQPQQPPETIATQRKSSLRPKELLADGALPLSLSLSPTRGADTAALAIAASSPLLSPSLDGESLEFGIILSRLAEVGFGIRVAGYVGRIAGGTPSPSRNSMPPIGPSPRPPRRYCCCLLVVCSFFTAVTLTCYMCTLYF